MWRELSTSSRHLKILFLLHVSSGEGRRTVFNPELVFSFRNPMLKLWLNWKKLYVLLNYDQHHSRKKQWGMGRIQKVHPEVCDHRKSHCVAPCPLKGTLRGVWRPNRHIQGSRVVLVVLCWWNS